MKFTELKQDLEGGSRRIYLIEGDDAYFRAKAEEQIKAKFLSMPELNFTAYEGSQLKGSQFSKLTDAVNVLPFMSELRMVKVSEFYPTDSEYEKYFRASFEDIPASTSLLIVNSGAQKGADLKKKKCVTFVDCKRADAETVAKWAYLTMKRAGVKASVEACEAVSAYCLCDMSRVSKEVDKLIEWSEGRDVTLADVDALVYKDADYRVYEMTNAVARGNYSEFTEICYDLASKGFDVNALVATLLNHFKSLLACLEMSGPDAEIAAKLKTRDFVVRKNREQARAIGEDRLCAFVGGLYSLASQMKSGLITPEGAFGEALATVFFS